MFQALPWLAFVVPGAGRATAFSARELLTLAAGPRPARCPGNAPTPELSANLAGLLLGGAGRLGRERPAQPRSWAGCFYLFNKGFDAATNAYTRIVGGLLRVSVLVLVLYGGLLGLTYWSFTHTPTGFIPSQDKGYLLVNVQLPDSSSLERTQQVMKQVEAIAGKLPGVAHTVAIAGQSILMNANAPNFGAMYVMLDDFHHRAAARAHRAR